MKSKLGLALIFSSVLILVLVVAAAFLLWSGPRPVCHRLVDAAFQSWMLETGQTNGVFPNDHGSGSNSLALMERLVGPEIQDYAYVPGLSYDDPADLVLMYMRTRTAYTWHADHSHTIFSRRRWMVLSTGIINDGGCPEGGGLLDSQEFKRRLEKTIAFLKEHHRPYSQVVAEEQSSFLRTIKN